jgi:hypothetical protein
MNIGSYSIPDVRLNPVLVNAVKVMYNKFESKDIDYDTLASLFDHKSAKSGAFLMKIAYMKAYNLIDGRGKVRVTETGRKIALPKNPEEENTGIIEAITNIPLWKEFYERFTKMGKEIPTSDFWIVLREICAITPEEAKNKAEQVRKAFLEDTIHIKVQKPIDSGGKNMDNQNQGGPSSNPSSPSGTTSYGASDSYGIWVKKDLNSIEFLESQIEAIKSWINHEKKQLETTKE